MYHASIPEWIEPKTMMDNNSPRAQKLDRSLFERMVLDLAPFNEVNKPGLLRNYAILAPTYQVKSDKFYRSMLEPTYTKIKSVLQQKLELDNPPTISVGLDGWSAQGSIMHVMFWFLPCMVAIPMAHLGWIDFDLGSFPWWVASVATYCPSMMVELPKTQSIQPGCMIGIATL